MESCRVHRKYCLFCRSPQIDNFSRYMGSKWRSWTLSDRAERLDILVHKSFKLYHHTYHGRKCSYKLVMNCGNKNDKRRSTIYQNKVADPDIHRQITCDETKVERSRPEEKGTDKPVHCNFCDKVTHNMNKHIEEHVRISCANCLQNIKLSQYSTHFESCKIASWWLWMTNA